jgi:RNA polymerase sigma-70 factor (ECF subfamily)
MLAALELRPIHVLFAIRRADRDARQIEDGHPVQGSDADLVRRALGGDRLAFDDLYRRHVDVVWRRLGRIIGPDGEREDLVQQIFFDVFRTLDRFRGEAAFATFLHRVMLNTAFDHLKRRARRPRNIEPEVLALLVDPAASPEHRAQEREQLAVSSALLDRIKPKKRIAFVLRVVEGLSLEEIAGLVDATPAAVAQRIRHAQAEIEAMVARAQARSGRSS